MGSTVQFALPRIAAPTRDELKARYRRPDDVPFPESNLYTPEKALLGQLLFHDTRLSSSGTLACATCHNAALGYADGHAKAIGQNNKVAPRHTPSVLNAAWGELLMWDGRESSLEKLTLDVLASPKVMNMPLDRLVQTVDQIAQYRPFFVAAFLEPGATPAKITEAIATYERTLVSGPAPFDAWVDGRESALSPAAKRGFTLFNRKAHCAACHSGWNFTDNGFHDVGLPDADRGRGKSLPNVIKMQHAFKTPSLRDVARRGPFMHDGSLPTLSAVVAHYNAGGSVRPSRSELVSPLGLTDAEQADLVVFLQSLSGEISPERSEALPR